MGPLKKGLAYLACMCLSLALPSQAFYIPGLSVRSYQVREELPLLVNKIYSDHSHIQYAYYDLPFVCPPRGHHTASGLLTGQHIPLNLGEVLRGDRIAISDFNVLMGTNSNCTILCTRQVTRSELLSAKELIKSGYMVEWILDNLPGATSFVTLNRKDKYYAAGFKLGGIQTSLTEASRFMLYNHHTIVVRVRKAPGAAGERGARIVVGFEVYPKSIATDVRRDSKSCPVDLGHIRRGYDLDEALEKTAQDATTSVMYTYSVYFREDDSVEYDSRWDRFYINQEETNSIHWLSIVNSMIISGLLTAVVTTLLARSIHADLKNHREDVAAGPRRRQPIPPNDHLSQKAGLDDLKVSPFTTQGTFISAEMQCLEDVPLTDLDILQVGVFSPPPYGHLLAPLVGSGMQILFVIAGLVGFGTLGLLGPSFRGGIVSASIGLFVFGGVFSGYFSARAYSTFDAGVGFYYNALLTATLFPGLIFSGIFVLNLFVWAQVSSTAIPFGTLLALLVLWLGVQVPLVYVGSWYGFKKAGPLMNHDAIKVRRTASSCSSLSSPDRSRKSSPAPAPSQYHKPPPGQAWYLPLLRKLLLSGLIPFSIILIEVFSIFHSLYADQNANSGTRASHLLAFANPSPSLASSILAILTLVLLLITVSETAILSVHLKLWSTLVPARSTQWWWHAFLVGASPAAWIFGYAAWHYHVNLGMLGPISTILYFGNALLASSVFGLLTGTVGFLSAFAFVKRVHGETKTD